MTTTIHAGDDLEPRRYGPLTTQMLVRYSGASGDFNPMHFDNSFATGAGYPGVFAHGMLQAAILATDLSSRWGSDSVRRFSVRFRDQAWPGEELVCSGTIRSIAEVDGERRGVLDLTITTSEGRVLLTADADVAI